MLRPPLRSTQGVSSETVISFNARISLFLANVLIPRLLKELFGISHQFSIRAISIREKTPLLCKRIGLAKTFGEAFP